MKPTSPSNRGVESRSGESSQPKPVLHQANPLKVSQPTTKASAGVGLLGERLEEELVVSGGMEVTILSRVIPVDRLHEAGVQDMITKTWSSRQIKSSAKGCCDQ